MILANPGSANGSWQGKAHAGGGSIPPWLPSEMLTLVCAKLSVVLATKNANAALVRFKYKLLISICFILNFLQH